MNSERKQHLRRGETNSPDIQVFQSLRTLSSPVQPATKQKGEREGHQQKVKISLKSMSMWFLQAINSIRISLWNGTQLLRQSGQSVHMPSACVLQALRSAEFCLIADSWWGVKWKKMGKEHFSCGNYLCRALDEWRRKGHIFPCLSVYNGRCLFVLTFFWWLVGLFVRAATVQGNCLLNLPFMLRATMLK